MAAPKDESSENSCSIRSLMEAYTQSELAGHVRAIQRECLLALRSVLDAGIERLSKKSTDTAK